MTKIRPSGTLWIRMASTISQARWPAVCSSTCGMAWPGAAGGPHGVFVRCETVDGVHQRHAQGQQGVAQRVRRHGQIELLHLHPDGADLAGLLGGTIGNDGWVGKSIDRAI